VLAPALKPETGRGEEGFPETVIIRNKKKEP